MECWDDWSIEYRPGGEEEAELEVVETDAFLNVDTDDGGTVPISDRPGGGSGDIIAIGGGSQGMEIG